MIALLIMLAFFFVQGAAAVAGHLEGTTSALVRGGIIWLLVICTLLYFAVRHKIIAVLRFCRPKEGSLKKLLFCVPLIVIALSHFAAGPASGLSIGLFAADLFLTLSIGMAEEIYFRGIICNVWLEKGPYKAMVISSVLFGISHLMNIAGGAGVLATLLQICFAFIYGLVFALIFIRSGSLIPCILLHALHDMCSFISADGTVTVNVVLGAVQTLILVIYFVYLMKDGLSPLRYAHDDTTHTLKAEK